MNHNKICECETIQILASCAIDGELSSEERNRLRSHLSECETCKSRLLNFEVLQLLLDDVDLPQLDPVDERMPVVSLSRQSVEQQFVMNKNRTGIATKLKFCIAGALVAAVVVAFAMVDLGGSPRPNGDELDLVQPVVKLSEINSQRVHDQELLRESMELDLRTLRMQVAAADDGSQSQFLERIEELLERIQKAEISSPEDYQEL